MKNICLTSNHSTVQLFLGTVQDLFMFQHILKPTRHRRKQTPSLLAFVFTDDENMIETLPYLLDLGIVTICVFPMILSLPRVKFLSQMMYLNIMSMVLISILGYSSVIWIGSCDGCKWLMGLFVYNFWWNNENMHTTC